MEKIFSITVDYLVITQKVDHPETNKYNAKRHSKSVYHFEFVTSKLDSLNSIVVFSFLARLIILILTT